MKILLVQPPIQDFYQTPIRLQPLGLAGIKSFILQKFPHFEVRLKDFHQGYKKTPIPLPPELNYLKPYYPFPDKSPFCSFHQYYHFGANFQEIENYGLEFKPEIIGISSLFSPYYREALTTAKILKRATGAYIILGGHHVSALPDFSLSHPFVDFVISGEGEESMTALVELLANGEKEIQKFLPIPGLGFKNREGGHFFNPPQEVKNLDHLPVPDFSDLNNLHYHFEKKPMTFLMTSRSCPHKCSFCSVHKTFSFNYRRRKVCSVISEMKKRYHEGIRVFDFEDDNLTYYKEEMRELCIEIQKEFPKKDIQLLAMNGISYLSLDAPLLELMKETGFSHLNLSLVSSDKTVRETTKRPHTVKKFLEVVQKAFFLKFQITGYQIIGLPMESQESMLQTTGFLAQLPLLIGASIFYRTPGSPIASQTLPPPGDDIFLSRTTSMAMVSPQIPRDFLYSLFISCRVLNFLKGLEIHGEGSLNNVLIIQETDSQRDKWGKEILNHFFKWKGMFGINGKKMVPLTQFDHSVLTRLLVHIEVIKTQKGEKIFLNKVPHISGSP